MTRMPRGPVRLLGVGHISVDHQFNVEVLPARPVKTPAHGHRCAVGGMTANACVAAARLGAAVRLLSPIGDDVDTASAFAAHLAAHGIAGDGLWPVAGASSSVSAVVIDGAGERLIVSHRGSALQQVPPLASTGLLRWLDPEHTDLLLVDPRCPRWAGEALVQARERGLPNVLDADTAPRADLQRLVALADWAVFSETGLAAYHDGQVADALAAALAAGAEVAVVTLGAAGLCWQRRGQMLSRLPAPPVSPVVDTLAAGDVFHGALGVARAEGAGDVDALRFASWAAALKCTRRGGVLGAPRRTELPASI